MAQQTITLPAAWWVGGATTRGWRRTIPNPDADAIAIDDALTPAGESAFLANLEVDSINRILLILQPTASGSVGRADLSSAWETNGSLDITVGTTTWTFQTDGDDTSDNYALTPSNTSV